jgi:pyruvate dehydrogenase E1 component
VRAYDPAYAYETAVIVMDGLKKLYQEGDTAIYYITVENENYVMPPMPEGIEEGIVRGIYQATTKDVDGARGKAQLFGSGAILRSVLRAQEILAERYNVSSNVWSVTSYNELARDAQACQRWNMLHPTEVPRQSYYEQAIAGEQGPFVAASDYVRAVPEQLGPFTPGGIFALGTDGMGRSESREALRRHFEVDAECVVIAVLHQLKNEGVFTADEVAAAIRDLGVDPEKQNPLYA